MTQPPSPPNPLDDAYRLDDLRVLFVNCALPPPQRSRTQGLVDTSGAVMDALGAARMSYPPTVSDSRAALVELYTDRPGMSMPAAMVPWLTMLPCLPGRLAPVQVAMAGLTLGIQAPAAVTTASVAKPSRRPSRMHQVVSVFSPVLRATASSSMTT